MKSNLKIIQIRNSYSKMSSPPPIKVIKSFYVPGLQFNMHHVTNIKQWNQYQNINTWTFLNILRGYKKNVRKCLFQNCHYSSTRKHSRPQKMWFRQDILKFRMPYVPYYSHFNASSSIPWHPCRFSFFKKPPHRLDKFWMTWLYGDELRKY